MDLQGLVNEAFARHQTGRLDEALHLYRKVLAVHPPIALVLSLAGEAATTGGDPAFGASMLRKALALEPRKSTFRQLLAFAEASQGNRDAAEASYAAAVELDPGNLSAMNDWANLIHVRHPGKARALVRKCVLLAPENPEQMRHLAELTVPEDVLAGRDLLRRTVRLNPGDGKAWKGLGVIELTEKDAAGAEAALKMALLLIPGDGSGYLRYADTLPGARRALGLKCFRRAILMNRSDADAWVAYANLLHAEERKEEAADGYRRGVLLDPRHLNALSNTLVKLADGGADSDLVRSGYARARCAHPASSRILGNYSKFLNERGLFTEAAEISRAALVAAGGADRDMLMGLSNAFRQSRKHARVERYLRLCTIVSPEDATIPSAILMGHNYESDVSAASLYRAHRHWAETYAPEEMPLGYEIDRAPDRVLHLGFQSPDLKRHPVGFFLMPVLTHLDRTQFKVSVYSDIGRGDHFTADLKAKAKAENWVDTRGTDDLTVRKKIIEDRVDILFDLPGHSASNRIGLFARRAAPLQMSWMGYVGTTGLSTMDYLVTDRFQTKAGTEDCYSEKWLVLPDDYICYVPVPTAPNVVPTPALKNGYVTFGSFNNPAKVTDDCLALWARVLAAVPDSRLLLSYKGYNDPGIQRDIRSFLSARGVAPERAMFKTYLYHEEFLGGYGEMDVALDTMPYSGGLTTCEALWMGVPVLALSSQDHFAGRHSFSHLNNAGFPQWTVDGPDAFVGMAATMVSDLDRLARIRQSLRYAVAASPLCDQPRYVRGVERKMRAAWQDYCAA